MLKYQTTGGKHSVSSPHIDLLFSMAKIATTSKQTRLPSEKQQIDSIRTMGKYLFQDQTDSTVTFEEKRKAGEGEKGRSGGGKEQRLNIYERGQLSKKKKYEKIVNSHRTQAQKILELSKTTSNTLNASKTNMINKSEISNPHPTTYKTKEAYMVKELLKRCIQQEEQLHVVKERQKKVQSYHSKSYLNQTTRERSPQGKRTATKKELQMIFEEVNQRSVQLKRRKQAKVQYLQEEQYEREMKGVTFHPQLQSSKSLRNSLTKGFFHRLYDDHRNRKHQKVEILAEQLKKDSFEPRLNSHRNSLSKSKINSFRIEDSVFLTARSKPELNFEKNLSRFIYPQEDQLTESRGQSMEIAMKAAELQFLFE